MPFLRGRPTSPAPTTRVRQHPGEQVQPHGSLRRNRAPRQLEALPRRVAQICGILRAGSERVALHRGPEPGRLPARGGLLVGVQGHALKGEANRRGDGCRLGRRRHGVGGGCGGGGRRLDGAGRGERGLLRRARGGRRRGGCRRRSARGVLFRGIRPRFRRGGGRSRSLLSRRFGFGRELVRAPLPEELQRRRLELGRDRRLRILNLTHGHGRQSARGLFLDTLALVQRVSGRRRRRRRLGRLGGCTGHTDCTARSSCRRLRRLPLPLQHELTLGPSRERTFGTMFSLRKR